MTRMTIAREGEVFNNCIILPGALKMPDEEIPVTWGSVGGPKIGRAVDLKRAGNEVTVEITFDEELELKFGKNWEAFAYVSPFVGKAHPLDKKALSEVSEGHIRAVCCHISGANPSTSVQP